MWSLVRHFFVYGFQKALSQTVVNISSKLSSSEKLNHDFARIPEFRSYSH